MVYRVDGVRTAIALALGLSPVLAGCTARVEDGSGGTSGVSTGMPSSSSGGAQSSGPIVDSTGSIDDGSTSEHTGSSSGSLDTSGGPARVCTAAGYPNVSYCFGAPNSAGECVCEGECQWEAARTAGELFADPGCGFIFSQMVCTEIWEGQCCFTANVFEDFCGGKGRPLIVDEQPRVASLVAGDAWGAGGAAMVRPAVAAHWLEAALDEHASVASFARFALELVSVGAPADLLADTAAAMRDEVRHAELAFALARRFGADAFQPGPLHCGPARSTSLEDVVVATVHEGCVGETLAAAHAELAAQRASDPVVASALKEIAADEARHAALAWRVVQWALSIDPSLREAVAEAFAASTALDMAPTQPVAAGLEAYGVLGAQAVEDVRTQTLRDTVRPFAEALLSRRSDRRAHAGSPA